ncbi:calcium signal-modulating cyclophilin ligand isoform X2 [Hoplias malabaricus]|uniref:calcium signal-modulating cyclophilin ligand isoform X2 n=1 Tax=Hoplias malabaricus TaxID=27720 RepID=UPI0034635179
MDAGDEASGRSAFQRRAESRRLRLLQNSQHRINTIVGFSKNSSDNSARRATEPHFHLDLDRNETWTPPVSCKRLSPYITEAGGSGSPCGTPERRGSPLRSSRENLRGSRENLLGEEESRGGLSLSADDRSRSPRRVLQQCLSRFDDALKMRAQTINENPPQDSGADPEELDSFRLFRLLGSILLAVFVRIFVCQYLSIFAPFLTLELAYMGLYKYFPKVEKKAKTTVLTAALLLSGIPAEVINHSMDTYRKMGDVFADLCVYFFTFIMCHELILLFGSESS